MKNLSSDIEISIKNSIEGMQKNIDILDVNDDKLERLVSSRQQAFVAIKDMLMLWQNSPNSPSDQKLQNYTKKLILAGDNSISVLRQALRKEIAFDELDAVQFGTAIKSKPAIFRAIQEIDSGLITLRLQLQSGLVDFKEREFKPGLPERYSNGEFFPISSYYKEWLDEKTQSIILCPKLVFLWQIPK